MYCCTESLTSSWPSGIQGGRWRHRRICGLRRATHHLQRCQSRVRPCRRPKARSAERNISGTKKTSEASMLTPMPRAPRTGRKLKNSMNAVTGPARIAAWRMVREKR
jgi:hypothetical protein